MTNHKILMIDDDSFIRKVYQTELSEKGYEVILAIDGDEGLAKAISEHPELIILDVMMPKMNGFKVIEELKKNPTTSQIPVIFLTHLSQAEDKQRGLALGASDYLVKDDTTSDILAQSMEKFIGQKT